MYAKWGNLLRSMLAAASAGQERKKSIQPALYAFQHSANYSASMIIMGAILLTRYSNGNLITVFFYFSTVTVQCYAIDYAE